MENPFLLAVALLESRGITTRFLSRTQDNEPDPRVGEEKPIDWRLLVDSAVETEGEAVNPSVAVRSSDQDQDSNTVTGKLRGQLVRRSLRFIAALAKGRPRDLSSVATPPTLVRPGRRPRKRGALHRWHAWRRRKRGTLHKKEVGEGGRTKCSERVTRSSCA
jgi:hypothetical protein